MTPFYFHVIRLRFIFVVRTDSVNEFAILFLTLRKIGFFIEYNFSLSSGSCVFNFTFALICNQFCLVVLQFSSRIFKE